MFLKFFISFTFLLPFLITCSHSKQIFDKENAFTSPGQFVVWTLADIQPVDIRDKKSFENAVEDVNTNIKGVDMAVVAGDIVNETNSSDFKWYLSTKRKSYIRDFYEIAGNHDLKPDEGRLFRKLIREDAYYKLEKGNLLFIFMSDEARGKATTIGDDTFSWWKKQVINNQDKVIVVVTHAPLEGSGIPFSSLEERKITGSERFLEVLKNYNVDIWLSGHLHLPNAFNNTITISEKLNGTSFIHISSIRSEVFGIKHSESRFLRFLCGTKKTIVHSRDHDKNEWQRELKKEIFVSRDILCN